MALPDRGKSHQSGGRNALLSRRWDTEVHHQHDQGATHIP